MVVYHADFNNFVDNKEWFSQSAYVTGIQQSDWPLYQVTLHNYVVKCWYLILITKELWAAGLQHFFSQHGSVKMGYSNGPTALTLTPTIIITLTHI